MQLCIRAGPVEVILPPVITEIDVQMLLTGIGRHQTVGVQLTGVSLLRAAEQSPGIFRAA